MPTKQNEISNIPNSVTNLENELPPLEVGIQPLDSIATSNIPVLVSCTMLFFISVLVFILMSHLIKNDKDPLEILKTFCIPLIIVSSVFVVIVGLDINKLTPVIGLLGTIAGYLLGKSEGVGDTKIKSKLESDE